MRRSLLLLIISVCLSACQALATTPAPVAVVINTATPAPTNTWPATWTPTSTRTPINTRTPLPTNTLVRPTLTPTPLDVDHPNWTAVIKRSLTPRPINTAPRTVVPRTPAPTATKITPTKPVELQVFAVGDSVMLGAARELLKAIPGLEVDAQVSRHVGVTTNILQQRRAAGRLGKVVIIHIGNNGYLTAKQFDDLMAPVLDIPRVLIFNLKEPRKWESPNNQVIAEGVARYPNAVLIDWHTFGMDHPDLFAKDGIHIGAAGAKAYTALVLPQLSDYLNPPAPQPVDRP